MFFFQLFVWHSIALVSCISSGRQSSYDITDVAHGGADAYCDGSSLGRNVCLFCDAMELRPGELCCSQKEAFDGCFQVTEFFLKSYKSQSSRYHTLYRNYYHKRALDTNMEYVHSNLLDVISSLTNIDDNVQSYNRLNNLQIYAIKQNIKKLIEQRQNRYMKDSLRSY